MSVVERALARVLSERVSLNRQVLENPYWCWPVDNKGHEDEMPVGRGAVSSSLCGKHVAFRVCDNFSGHEGVVLDGVNYTKKLAVMHEHLWCHKPSCPVCFIRGWAVREALAMAGRLAVASERGFGEVEHFTVSLPIEDYGLPFKEKRRKSTVACLNRGVLGAGLIYHGFRINSERGVLSYGPHFHGLGFIRGGFDICRDCIHGREDCRSCNGFKGREVRGYEKDRYLVKVFEKRNTVVGTSFYQLHHATIRVSLRRFHVVTWIGLCGCSKLKGRKVKPEPLCPVCAKAGVHSEMVKKVYVGKEHIARNIGDREYRKVFAMDEFDGSGLPNFIDFGGGGDG
ncbi:MAG: hypothetical protein ABR962_05650 [Candidatus Bathyarchaeia archaeon]